MTYTEYKEKRARGLLKAGIDNSVALRLMDYLPKRYQYAHIFWSWVWMLSIPAAILLMIFVKWWVGLLVLVFVTPTIFSAAKKSAAQFVLEHADENEEFFNRLVEKNLLIFKE